MSKSNLIALCLSFISTCASAHSNQGAPDQRARPLSSPILSCDGIEQEEISNVVSNSGPVSIHGRIHFGAPVVTCEGAREGFYFHYDTKPYIGVGFFQCLAGQVYFDPRGDSSISCH